MSNLKIFNSRKRNKKSAFSLIELSIVLIIIGLLVAGITGGASLIRTAELRTVMNEARGYAVAVNSFFGQYDELPGDFDTNLVDTAAFNDASAATAVGDANGNIEHINAANTLEGHLAWMNLETANIITENLDSSDPVTVAAAGNTPALTTTGANTSDIPAGPLGDSAWVFDSGTIAGDIRTVLVLTGGTVAAVTDDNTANPQNHILTATLADVVTMTPSDLLSIDSKMDDGIGNTGDVVDFVEIGDATNGCSNAGAYEITATTDECAPGFVVNVLN